MILSKDFSWKCQLSYYSVLQWSSFYKANYSKVGAGQWWCNLALYVFNFLNNIQLTYNLMKTTNTPSHPSSDIPQHVAPGCAESVILVLEREKKVVDQKRTCHFTSPQLFLVSSFCAKHWWIWTNGLSAETLDLSGSSCLKHSLLQILSIHFALQKKVKSNDCSIVFVQRNTEQRLNLANTQSNVHFYNKYKILYLNNAQ